MRWHSVYTASLLIVGACTGQDSLRHHEPSLAFDSVAMQRSGCLGRCPIYQLKISSDGRVTFQGEKHVAYVGRHTGSARASDLARLDQALKSVEFFTLRRQYHSGEDGCTTWSTDSPTVEIRVAAGGKEHEVNYYYGCEVEIGPTIDMLSKTIDDVAGAYRWVGRRAY